jgi:hypothetical protein
MEKSQPPKRPLCRDPISLETRIHILLEEYRALYRLLTFRLTAMDRRLPAIGGMLAAILGSTTAMPDQSRLAFLLGLPIALLWLFLSTVQHARSKEDHLRRIDEIERLVNRLAGEELLVFQSRHPNKARHPGGRTGFGSVVAILTVCLTLLGACMYAVQTPSPLLSDDGYRGYSIYLFASATLMLTVAVRLTRYRYRRPPIDGPPIFEVHRAE